MPKQPIQHVRKRPVEQVTKRKILKSEPTMLEKMQKIDEEPKVELYVSPMECIDWYINSEGKFIGNVMFVSISGYVMYLQPGRNLVPLCVAENIWGVREKDVQNKQIAQRKLEPNNPMIAIRPRSSQAMMVTSTVKQTLAEMVADAEADKNKKRKRKI